MNGPDEAPVFSTRVAWTLSPDREPDAPSITHQLRCISEDEQGNACGSSGPRSSNARDAHAWAFLHAKDEPAHRTFYDMVEMPYSLSPAVEPDEDVKPSRIYPPEH
ncbi:DUF7848 domain-containing protein [Kitasatospora aureofaciens]